jgi:MscS family membrane protein
MLSVVPQVRDVLVIVLIAWFLVRFLKRAEDKVLADLHEASSTDETTVRAVVKLLRMAVMITATLVILQSLGYSIEGVLAFGGVGGIAVGFAAKDLLANFFGGLMVYLDRPFAVGDWIRSPDKQIEGVVEDIGWRLTRIRTFDKRPLYVPNSVFTSIAVENPSRMTNRRIYETVGLRYNDMRQVKDIVAQVRSMLESHQEIDHDKTLIVNFNAFGESSLDFFIYTFTKTTDWVWFHEVKQEILLNVMDIIHANGADIAYPTSTVILPQGALEAQASN